MDSKVADGKAVGEGEVDGCDGWYHACVALLLRRYSYEYEYAYVIRRCSYPWLPPSDLKLIQSARGSGGGLANSRLISSSKHASLGLALRGYLS